MVQNLVLNNSSHDFSAHSDAVRASEDQTRVVATPGTDAAILSNLRAQLESGALTGGSLKSAGIAVHADYKA